MLRASPELRELSHSQRKCFFYDEPMDEMPVIEELTCNELFYLFFCSRNTV